VQLGAAWQVPLEQNPLAQSAGPLQLWPFAHWLEQMPPQSRSVSVPFRKPSLQVGTAHLKMLGLQKPL